YFEISTLSPFFTVKSTFFPLSSILPVPKATTFPSCGFSLAVSGMMIPPFFTSCSSSGCTSTRSPRGLTLTDAIGYFVYSLVCCYAGDPVRFGAIGKLLFTPETSGRLTQTPYNPYIVDSQFSNLDSRIISSCRRQRLRTPHRQRRRCRACLRLLLRHRLVAIAAQVADLDADQLALTPACKVRR